MEKKIDNKSREENLIIRAKIKPSESTDYDFEAIAVPVDNKQLRYSFSNGEYFYQVLKTDPSNVKSERLDSGLPLFDNHPEPEDQCALEILGITVSYEFTTEGILIRAKLGARADDALRSDIKNRIVKTVSIEGDILQYEVSRTNGQIPIYNATLWEPTSLSFAPIPQDISSQISVQRALKAQIEKIEPKSIINNLIQKF